MGNIKIEFIVTGWTIEEAKAFYNSIVDHLGRDHQVTGAYYPADETDPLYEAGDHETPNTE